MINEIKTTAHNMLHCNENARRAKVAEEATKKVAVIGGAATLTSMIAGFLAKRAWKKKYMSLETKIDSLENQLSEIQKCYGFEPEPDYSQIDEMTDEEVDENG